MCNVLQNYKPNAQSWVKNGFSIQKWTPGQLEMYVVYLMYNLRNFKQ